MFQKINYAVCTCFWVTSHFSSCFSTITTINLNKSLWGGVQMTQKKTVAITIQDHRSLWNSSNPEEVVHLLILNVKHRSFHLHTSTSCSPTFHPHTTNSCSQSSCPHASYSCHLLLHPHTSSSSQFFHPQTHLLTSHAGNYNSCPLTLHLRLLSASHSLCLFTWCSELHVPSNTVLIWHHMQCRKTQTNKWAHDKASHCTSTVAMLSLSHMWV